MTPFLINTAGWVMTEMGRQPWIVQGLLKTEDANSPRVSSGQVALTLVGFVLLFTVLGGIALWLFLREAKHVRALRRGRRAGASARRSASSRSPTERRWTSTTASCRRSGSS